jgi:hypothetical protein
MAVITAAEAREIAEALELDVYEIGICHACLSFVSFPLDRGDAREVRRALRFITGDLWAEGLELPARAALERARGAGVPHAEAALADVEAQAHRSPVVREIVLRLAADLSRRTKEDLRRLGLIPIGDGYTTSQH